MKFIKLKKIEMIFFLILAILAPGCRASLELGEPHHHRKSANDSVQIACFNSIYLQILKHDKG
ncbi:MAG: hypothetical protein ACD_73C00244G0003 [uncultured bacterium]|nr:MAG: hypothetical protein ACD_73C00244G0003 [uncultured bacterium]